MGKGVDDSDCRQQASPLLFEDAGSVVAPEGDTAWRARARALARQGTAAKAAPAPRGRHMLSAEEIDAIDVSGAARDLYSGAQITAIKRTIGELGRNRQRKALHLMLEHGWVTLQQVRDPWGDYSAYATPERAIKDLGDLGITLESEAVPGEGVVQRYRFVSRPDQLRRARRNLTGVRSALIERDGPACHRCQRELDPDKLQVDHRIPVLVAGERDELELDAFVLLCATCNRRKGFTCQKCPNGKETQDPETCATCYWAFGERHDHDATEDVRRLAGQLRGEAAGAFDVIQGAANNVGARGDELIIAALPALAHAVAAASNDSEDLVELIERLHDHLPATARQ